MIGAIMAVIMGAAIIAAVWWLPIWGLSILIMVAIVLGLFEYGRMFLGDWVWRLMLVVFGAALAAVMLFGRVEGEILVLLLIGFVFACALAIMWRVPSLLGSAEKTGLAALGLIYLGLAFPFWGWIRALEQGRALVILALACACLCDTFAFLAGKTLGRHKLAPLVSPNKTKEGFAGALVGSVLAALVVWRLALPHQPVWEVLVLAAIIWITSPLGDLVESMLKRSCGVKDSGRIIPGHGGVLDRLDALIFTGPAAYAYIKYVMIN